MMHNRNLALLALAGTLVVLSSLNGWAAQEIYGARVCVGEDNPIVTLCEPSGNLNDSFDVTGWNSENAQVYVASGKQIIPKNSEIVINKKGLYRIVFEMTLFYDAETAKEGSRAGADVEMRTTDGDIIGGCGTPAAQAALFSKFADPFAVTECKWSGSFEFAKGDAVKLIYIRGVPEGVPIFVQFRLDLSRLQ